MISVAVGLRKEDSISVTIIKRASVSPLYSALKNAVCILAILLPSGRWERGQIKSLIPEILMQTHLELQPSKSNEFSDLGRL